MHKLRIEILETLGDVDKPNFMNNYFFSKYSTLKLGATNDEPEYNFVSWFVMLFACGISNGIFQYSVYGPIHNYTKRNRFFANPMLPDNELAQMSILQTMFHFGNYDYISSFIDPPSSTRPSCWGSFIATAGPIVKRGN